MGSPPRVRERLTVVVAGGENLLGSPPRVRERRLEKNDPLVDYGITPACAGKT